MRPAVRKGILRGTGIALVLIFLATDASAVAAENAPPSIHGETEYVILLDPLARTRREEETLLGTMRETAKAASQPHAEYLLYQGSLHFAEQDARLAPLKMEKKRNTPKTGPAARGDGSLHPPPLRMGGRLRRPWFPPTAGPLFR